MIRLGVIGYGHRIHNFLNSMDSLELGTIVTALADPDEAGARRRMGERAGMCRFYESADAMLKNQALDAVLVGTRCKLHTEMALKVLDCGIPLFLEKPVGICEGDLTLLENAAKVSAAPVVVSFPLRFAPIVQAVRDIVNSGRIGSVAQVQIYNNVPYGDVYFQNWYRDTDETGGLFLQKATHDFDYVNMLLGSRPVQTAAMKTRTFYPADHPDTLRCENCRERESCPQSDFHKLHFTGETVQGPMCAYGASCRNEDSASVLLMYENGVHGVYTQNFFAKLGAQKRGARLLGTKGSVEFDFYTDEIRVNYYQVRHTEFHRLEYAGEAHFGGDLRLAHHFLNVVRGLEPSASTLEDGIYSARICLAARTSAEKKVFQDIG